MLWIIEETSSCDHLHFNIISAYSVQVSVFLFTLEMIMFSTRVINVIENQ